MGPYRSWSIVAVLIFTIFTVSSALNMSIISYDSNNHLRDSKSSGSWRTDNEVMSIYEWWLAEHGKAYNALGEKERSFQIFKDNLRYIDEQNSKNLSYKLGLNMFVDLSNEEYRNTYLGAKTSMQMKRVSNRNTKSDRYAPHVGDSLPDSIDWRKEGAVSPVKDQGSFGSCWAFSTISAVEGINKLVTGDLIPLSEQELVDCDKTYNEGCNRGLMDYGFEFIINNGGIDSEKDYPYKGYDAKIDILRGFLKLQSALEGSAPGKVSIPPVELPPSSTPLKQDYEEILNAWSDKGLLYIDGGDPPQTVPDLMHQHDHQLFQLDEEKRESKSK